MMGRITVTINLLIITLLMVACQNQEISHPKNETLHNCDPSKIIGVELKSGKEDRGVKYYEDMSFGIDGETLVGLLKKMHVNNIRIPIMTNILPDKRADVIVDFLRKIQDGGGQDIDIILSVRRWNMDLEKQQKSWSEDLAYVFNSIKDAGLDDMVVGCSFDENGDLREKQSNKDLWDKRHAGILLSMDKLNKLTRDAFKSRTVFIHGKGLGAQFKGVKASSDSIEFADKMKLRCANYCYNFKFFRTGFPEDSSVQGWIDQLYNYCGLKEVVALGVPLIFVGDSGDGIRGNAFKSNTCVYDRCGPNIVHALSQVFAESRWTGFSFGVFFGDGKPLGRTILYRADNNKAQPQAAQIAVWKIWKENMENNESQALLKNGDIEARIYNEGDGSLPYRILKPVNYNVDEKYPLVVALHGAWGRGTDNKSRAIDAFQILSKPEVRQKYPAFIITPQCPSKEMWANTPWGKGCYSIDKVKISKPIELVLDIIKSLQDEYNIDPDRIYVTGQSMGGFGTWDIIMRRPELFAAAVPVCGAGDISQAKNLMNLPIWCFHGGLDTIVPVAGDREMDKVMTQLGNTNWNYTEYPNVKHGASKPTWKEKDLIPWIFNQKK